MIRMQAAPLAAARKRAKSSNWEVVEGTCTFAEPAGTVTREAYEGLREEILDQLKAAMPVDIVLIAHGLLPAQAALQADLAAAVSATAWRFCGRTCSNSNCAAPASSPCIYCRRSISNCGRACLRS